METRDPVLSYRSEVTEFCCTCCPYILLGSPEKHLTWHLVILHVLRIKSISCSRSFSSSLGAQLVPVVSVLCALCAFLFWSSLHLPSCVSVSRCLSGVWVYPESRSTHVSPACVIGTVENSAWDRLILGNWSRDLSKCSHWGEAVLSFISQLVQSNSVYSTPSKSWICPLPVLCPGPGPGHYQLSLRTPSHVVFASASHLFSAEHGQCYLPKFVFGPGSLLWLLQGFLGLTKEVWFFQKDAQSSLMVSGNSASLPQSPHHLWLSGVLLPLVSHLGHLRVGHVFNWMQPWHLFSSLLLCSWWPVSWSFRTERSPRMLDFSDNVGQAWAKLE